MDENMNTANPSEAFMRTVCKSGSIVITCGFCNRTHFGADETLGWDDGERAELLAKAAATPDRYLEHDSDYVSWGEVDGKVAVDGCPCDGPARVEAFIWSHRDLILDYLKTRSQRQLAEARRLATKVEDVAP